MQAYNSVCKNPTDECLRRGGRESVQKSGRRLCSATNDNICGVRDPGQWKEATVQSLRKASDALQRATSLGPSRSVARNISMGWRFCDELFGGSGRKSREAGRAGRQRRPFSQAAPGQPGLLRGDFLHASVRKGSRRGSDGRKIAGHCGPDGRGACRQMSSGRRKTTGESVRFACASRGMGGYRKPQGPGHQTLRKKRRFQRENPDEPTNLRSGRKACCASNRSLPGRMVVWTQQKCCEKDRVVIPREAVTVKAEGRCSEAAKAETGGA